MKTSRPEFRFLSKNFELFQSLFNRLHLRLKLSENLIEIKESTECYSLQINLYIERCEFHIVLDNGFSHFLSFEITEKDYFLSEYSLCRESV